MQAKGTRAVSDIVQGPIDYDLTLGDVVDALDKQSVEGAALLKCDRDEAVLVFVSTGGMTCSMCDDLRQVLERYGRKLI